MKNEAIVKINKMGKISHTITVVMRVCLIIGLVCSILGFIAVFCLPKDLITVNVDGNAKVKIDLSNFNMDFVEGDIDNVLKDIREGEDSEFEVNGVEYDVLSADMNNSVIKVEAASEGIEFTLRDLWLVAFMGILLIVASLITLKFIDKLCLAFKNCESPFEENVINALQKFAYSLIPWAIISTFTSGVVNGFFAGNIDIVLGVDLGMVVLILVILAIAYVFKYGAILQKESDETL